MDPTNRNTALASAFVEELARCGLRHAVLSPGSRSTPLALALWRQPEIDVTVIVDERSAAFFALGAAQATRAPVAMLCTSGTAAANFHPAICEADESGVPLIALTADRPPELRGIGAGQTIDQLKLYGSSVRWFCEVGTHEADDEGLLHYRSVACRAFAAARGEPRPGPVHLNLPWREPLAPVPVEGAVTATDPLALEGRDDAAADGGDPDRHGAVRVPARGGRQAHRRRPLGGDRRRATARPGAARAPRPTSPAPRDSRSSPSRPPSSAAGRTTAPTSVTTYDLLLRDERFRGTVEPDLVLRFGEMPTSKPLRTWLAESGADQIVVDPLGGWNEPTRRAAALLRADPTELAAGWAARLGEEERGDPAAWLDAERAAREAIEMELADLEDLTEAGLQLALGRAYRDGDLVYTASSMPIRDQEAYLPAGDADLLFLANRGANGIDGLVSSGIGAAHATGRPTTIVTGDLGFLHDLGGLAALRDVSTPVRIVVIDNDGGGIFHHLPQAEALEEDEFEALLGTPRGVDVAGAATLFGLSHHRIERFEQLPEALASGTCLIEVPVTRPAAAAGRRA